MVVVGLASVIIGEALVGKRNVILGILSVVGSVAYKNNSDCAKSVCCPHTDSNLFQPA